MKKPKIKESFVEVEDGFKVWAKVIGGGAPDARPALLVVHGGPGAGHDYLENLSALADDQQQVIFYDQLGCGRSDKPNDPDRWKLQRFVHELASVRTVLELNNVIILGHSWGGMLAIEYLHTKPLGLAGLILSNSLSSVPLLGNEVLRLQAELPTEDFKRLETSTLNDLQAAADKKVVSAFYSRHILRMDPLPDHVLELLTAENQVYEVMWGKNELAITGNLKSWERTAELSNISQPTLIISGEFDESTPLINRTMHEKLKRSQWVLMPGCSHLPMLENPVTYLRHLKEFIDDINQRSDSNS